jgi:hypothetical protein
MELAQAKSLTLKCSLRNLSGVDVEPLFGVNVGNELTEGIAAIPKLGH